MQIQRLHVFATKLLAISKSPSVPQMIPIPPLTMLHVVTVCWTAFPIHIFVLPQSPCISRSGAVILWSTALCVCINDSQRGHSHTSFSPPLPPLVFVTVNSQMLYFPSIMVSINITTGNIPYAWPVSTPVSCGFHMGQSPRCGCSHLVSMVVWWTMLSVYTIHVGCTSLT